jgi:hypothetical protein
MQLDWLPVLVRHSSLSITTCSGVPNLCRHSYHVMLPSQSRILANELVCTEAHSLCDDASLVSMHAALIQHRNSGFYLHALSAVQAHSCS